MLPWIIALLSGELKKFSRYESLDFAIDISNSSGKYL
jgi:hypothetical protein